MIKLRSMEELISLSRRESKPIWETILRYEIELTGLPKEKIVDKMKERINAMKQSIEKAREQEKATLGGLAKGEAKLLRKTLGSANNLAGDFITSVMADALAVAIYNATMGKIVAAPTAGSCGILPAALFNVQEKLGLGTKDMIKAMFVSAGIGIIISKKATLSGAEAGCQAECGTAAAMAAGAVASLRGADDESISNAAALALKNSLGLSCDPVATLVEVPCIKRNAFFAVHAVLAADMACSGIKSVIPFDEVIWAMRDIGSRLPRELRETAGGGLAITQTGQKIAKEVLKTPHT